MSALREELRGFLSMKVGLPGGEATKAAAELEKILNEKGFANPILSLATLSKLASIICHYEEYLDTHNVLDLQSANSVRSTNEVVEIMEELDDLCLLPLKREQ